MENNPIYTNKFDVSFNEHEAQLTFKWMSAVLSDDGRIDHHDILMSQTVAMSKSTLFQLAAMLADLLNKEREDLLKGTPDEEE